MPGLIAFNRRWGIGSDDFVFPELLELCLRVIWLTVIAIVYSVHSESIYQCKDGNLLKIYYIGFMALLSVAIIICACIVYVSSRGTIMITGPRKKLAKLLYLKLVITVPEIVWNILGTYWSFLRSSNCQVFVVKTVQGAVLTGWILGVLVIIGIIVVFDPLGKLNKIKPRISGELQSKESTQFLEGAMSAAKKAWEKRCRLLCCCVLGDEQSKDAFDEISQLLADFFQDLDLVPTDIAAGLILVQRDQEKLFNSGGKSYNTFAELQTSVKAPVGSSNDTPIGPTPWMTSTNMHHYMKYAAGSYGWPMYMFTHLATGLCRLCGACRCHTCYHGGEVIDDNCCQCHTAAIRRQTNIADQDLPYVTFHNKIFQIPFYVAIDRAHQTVVVSVRGTLSLKDAVTDMSAECDPLEMLEDAKAHRGMLQAAKYIQEQLQSKSILDAAFQQVQGAGLMICGHSLGAGVASLLALLLKSDYPDVRCFAYSPPGGLLSYNASVFCRDFICSVILGKDFIPRLGLVSMEDLKAKTLQCIANSKIPKYRILVAGVWELCCSCKDDSSISDLEDTANLVEENRTNSSKKSIEQAIQNTIQAREEYKITHTPMYPPGQVLHIQEVDTERKCFEDPSYFAEWKDPKDFTEILVCPEMVYDHFPDKVLKALEQLSQKNFTPRSKFKSQSADTNV
ncbi:diacylglycerol lipase-beta-like isoform X2 [Saccostrea echinata]|uniref:diacylglycerol lipase-beta-like isoform X2 n=1 Tax=Saccostrea echinata TaxID=191078 RepID=UPI002A823F87|nr:diacylglycerol lipase-beta-like isoform X2 [Saccostrea echinata]